MKGGDVSKKTPGADNRVLRVCRLLNRYRVKYLIAGGVAANLHGTLRSTKDVDLLVPKDRKNTEALLKALSELPYGVAKEIEVEDILDKPFTIIGDDPRVDILTLAGKVDFKKAQTDKEARRILGVKVPFIGLRSLKRSKDTGRAQDKADLEQLKLLKK